MTYESTIRAFQSTLSKFRFDTENLDFPEDFAVRRFLKKFQVPDPAKKASLKLKCWEDWLSYDQELVRVDTSRFILFGELYKARLDLHRLRKVKFDSFDLPNGSEFTATRGQNSVESRLQRSQWTCTRRNFERFALFVYECAAMKRAFRERYHRWYQEHSFIEGEKAMDKYIYREYRRLAFKLDPVWESFKFKLGCVVHFTEGSRFSTVPKNNETDRPINIEPFGNIVVQRQIGNFLRGELKRLHGVDLDSLSDTHRRLISDKRVATIDLKNASDSITLALCEFLLPKHIFSVLADARSEFVLGLDGSYHLTKKISSMGNGFTFELMTLILTSIAKVLDPNASVFGDDIIIVNEKAQRLIEILRGIGFHVNEDKSFISSPFRESCGGNYHDDFGYIESFDFRYPENIHDCIVIYNKCLRLSKFSNFERLLRQLRRHVPTALQGIIEPDFFTKETRRYDATTPVWLSGFFRVTDHESFKARAPKPLLAKLVNFASKYNYRIDDLKVFHGVSYREKLRSKTLRLLSMRKHYGKYGMYLHAGRASKDVLTGSGDWVSCLFLSVAGTTMRWSDSALE